MRRYPGFLNNLQTQIENLPEKTFKRVSRAGGLDIHDLLALLIEPKDHTVDCPDTVSQDEIFHYSQIGDNETLGAKLVQDDAVSFCILAGGAGTRAGGPKCLLKFSNGESLLSTKIRQAGALTNIWVIVSHGLRQAVVDHLNSLQLMNDSIRIIEQYESVRLTPDNQLFLDGNEPSLYPCGHGDAIPALVSANLVKEFTQSGGKHIYIVNVDNVVAGLDKSILGLHHNSNLPVTCEVVKKNEGDAGGFLCKHSGINQIVESFRMSSETDVTKFQHINTNTMIVKADLDFSTINWSWHRVKKQLDGKLVIQYERLLQQLTEHFKTQFVEVDRQKRFTPVKSASDLDKLKFA